MNLSEKQAQFQEHVNRRVLIDWIRITGLSNPRRRSFDNILEEFAFDVIGYPRENGNPFSWPTHAGVFGNSPAIRAKITYDFWKHFLKVGRKNLFEHNRRNGTDIRISREKTISLQEMDRLGLYIRKKIRQEYAKQGTVGKEISLVKGMLRIGDDMTLRPTVAAVKLGINMDEWTGTPLMDMLNKTEKEELESGKLCFGSIVLPGINLNSNRDSTSNVNVEATSLFLIPRHLSLDLDKDSASVKETR
ncbi:hypothetical protein Q1695_012447 [Nippostrongylus brasiliensis]|nr:hypothetical protein Q1695_012447 [Nippostrongylus brasiliensis]